MFNYEILVAFDADIASIPEIETYSRVADKYDAYCMGHEKTGTCSMFILTEECLNLEELDRYLGDIKLIRVMVD